MSGDLHRQLKIWINEAERGAVDDCFHVHPEESVRDGWHRAYCLVRGCDWTTTGLENPVEEAAYEHVYDTHRSAPQAVEALQALAALRAAVKEHTPTSCFQLCGLRHEHITCAVCKGPGMADLQHWPCSTIRTIAEALGVRSEGDH